MNPVDVLKMKSSDFRRYQRCIEIIRARERLFIVQDNVFPHLEKKARKDAWKILKDAANPKELFKPVVKTLDEAWAIFQRMKNG